MAVKPVSGLRLSAAWILTMGLLSGCQLLPPYGSAPGNNPTTDATHTMGGRADEAAAEAQAPRAREILEALWDQFDLPDKPPLDEKAADGGETRMCTLDINDHITSWAEGAGLRVSEEENPELEERQAELVRVWLDENGWERIDSPAPDSTVTYHRNSDGFFVTVAPQLDARVFLDVKSPCFNEDGERVNGTSSRP